MMDNFRTYLKKTLAEYDAIIEGVNYEAIKKLDDAIIKNNELINNTDDDNRKLILQKKNAINKLKIEIENLKAK